MNLIRLRWWMFCRLCALGWWVCPQSYRSHLQASMTFDKTMWDDPDRAFAERYAARRALEEQER